MTTADEFIGPSLGAAPVRRAERPVSTPRPLYAARILPHGRRKRTFSDDWPLRRVLVILLAVIGAGVMLYPSAAAWLSDLEHDGKVNAYVAEVQTISATDQQSLLDAANAYNAALPDGPLRDPYTLTAAGEAADLGDGLATYRDTLAVGPGGMMGVVDIPEIGVELPIYHDTSEATLSKGLGHLYGSTLPVGGTGTHAVLTGHSGYVNATLLNELNQLRKGDTFTIAVLGEVLTYQVDQILTVLPNETEALRRVPGKDYVTLITCTPTGVNSHRLLVRGSRIPTPVADAASATYGYGGAGTRVPWWAVWGVTAVIVVVLATWPLRRRTRGLPRHAFELE